MDRCVSASRRVPAHRTTRSATSLRAFSRREDSRPPSERPSVIDLRRYVALGDSMSIDLYPALDAGDIDVAVALERNATAGRVEALGAASLFYRNDDARWPEEIGNDLASRFPAIEYANLAA